MLQRWLAQTPITERNVRIQTAVVQAGIRYEHYFGAPETGHFMAAKVINTLLNKLLSSILWFQSSLKWSSLRSYLCVLLLLVVARVTC